MKQTQPTFRSSRRLTFERCEPRLTLSGNGLLAQGGFIQFDVGDYLLPAANSFLQDTVSLDAQGTGFLTIVRNDGSPGTPLVVSNQYPGVGSGQLPPSLLSKLTSGTSRAQDFDNFDSTHIREFLDGRDQTTDDLTALINDHLEGDSPSGTQILDAPYDPPELVRNEGPADSDLKSLLPSGNSLAEGAGSDAPVADSPLHAPSIDSAEAPALPSITVPEALRLGKDTIELEHPILAESADGNVEGGPIEVARAVAQTQRAYEAEIFAEVAARLEGQDSLAQGDPPVAEPLVGELARTVVFEMAGQDSSTEEAAPRGDTHSPSAALPTTEHGAIGVAAVAVKDDREPDADSRSWAFAQWPLFFSATLGLALAGNRRWRQPEATLQPPRRSRQTPAS